MSSIKSSESRFTREFGCLYIFLGKRVNNMRHTANTSRDLPNRIRFFPNNFEPLLNFC